jgi:hypothetical protein
LSWLVLSPLSDPKIFSMVGYLDMWGAVAYFEGSGGGMTTAATFLWKLLVKKISHYIGNPPHCLCAERITYVATVLKVKE